MTFHVTRWTTGQEAASFHNIQRVVFSPQGTQLAVVRDDGVIEGYAFPLRTPWGLIGGAAVVAAGTVWSVGWLWACWRARKAVT